MEVRRRAQPLRSTSAESRTDRIGSIGVQPVSQTIPAARMAAIDPSMSPSTCSVAPATLTCPRSPRRSATNTAAFTARPRIATIAIGPARTGAGWSRRAAASQAIQPTSRISARALTKPASTSKRM